MPLPEKPALEGLEAKWIPRWEEAGVYRFDRTRTRDQIYLPKGEATTEEILVRQRQLATGYQYFLNFGISYSFGSIFNNIVNPRFGGGGGNFFFFD